MKTFKKLEKALRKREIKNETLRRRCQMIYDAEMGNRELISAVSDIIYTDNNLNQAELGVYYDYYDMLCEERRKILRRKAIRKLFRRWV